MLFILALLFGVVLAQRPSNASICDYYAERLYGTNNTATQFQLVEAIVGLAFGGSFNLTNISSDITGILNPGIYQTQSVDLRPWFNGSLDSTNLNNQPVGIDWLDDGGLDPLYNFLSGTTPTVVLTNTTNEYRLFNHFYLAHSHIFGCSDPPPPLPNSGPPLNLAYVHKYMNLNYTDLAYFIDQLSKATLHYGFSAQDSQTLATQLNSLYNVRCAPAITQNPTEGPQLLSLCQASNCPLAEPNPDCASYVNLTADGAVSSASSTSVLSTFTSTSTASSATTTSSAASSSTSSHSRKLSGGAIAGIAIGAAVIVLLLVGAIIFLLRQRKLGPEPVPDAFGPVYGSSSASTKHNAKVSDVQPMAEMESPRPFGNPEMSFDRQMDRPVEKSIDRPIEKPIDKPAEME